MKLVLKGFFSILLLLSATGLIADDCNSCNTKNDCGTEVRDCNRNSCPEECGTTFGKTFFSYRPQDSNVARRMVGVIDKTHLFGKEEWYGTLTLALQYQKTFHNHDLARFLSFTDSRAMTYGPTCGAFDIYGLNFGVTGTNGNFGPAGASTSSTTGNGVCLKPRISNFIAEIDLFTGLDEFVCGLWTRLTLPVVRTNYHLKLNDNGGTPSTAFYPDDSVTINTATAPVPFKNLADAWANLGAFGDAPEGRYGKICGKRKETALAGLHMEVGYDFWRCERGFAGVGIHAVAPTGTRPHARLFFEPVVGANHSWQVGGTVQAGYRLWENCDGNQSLAAYFDSVVTHLFGAKQRRLYGLRINGVSSPGSSFLLLKKFDAAGAVTGLERAENLLALEGKIKADVMADLALMLQYDKCNWSSAIGYNFWLRTHEKGRPCATPFSNADVRYAIKGSALATGPDTQSTATIGTCGVTDAVTTYITEDQVDPCLALNRRAFSNKVFGFVGYNWKDCEWTPFVLLEGEVEFGHENKAADQWGVMVKGGISF